MSFHHLAITTKDMVATHRFYTETVGFTLAKVDVLDLPGGGWARHAFYDTGDRSLLAVLEPHDESLGEFRTDLSTGLGLPSWANHVAFGVADFDALEQLRHRLLEHGPRMRGDGSPRSCLALCGRPERHRRRVHRLGAPILHRGEPTPCGRVDRRRVAGGHDRRAADGVLRSRGRRAVSSDIIERACAFVGGAAYVSS